MTHPVGIVGIGIMGSAMAANLLQVGFAVHGYDPAPAAMAAFTARGGVAVASPAAVADAAGIVITSLPSPEALAAAAASLAEAADHRQIVIECSTLPVQSKQAAHDQLLASGKTLLDCPLSGTGAQAVTRDLVILGSGDQAAFEACAAVFDAIARRQTYLGPFGRGSVMKFLANHLVTIHNVAAAEAMVLGIKAGLDPAMIYDTLVDSAATSRMLQVRGPMMRDAAYDSATATIRTHLKDIGIIGAFAAELNCPVPLFASAVPVYTAGAALGFGAQDSAAVCAVLEIMAGVERRTVPG